MFSSTPFIVGLRIFLMPALIFGAVLYFQNTGGHKALLESTVMPELSELDALFDGLMGGSTGYQAPIAEAKFLSVGSRSAGTWSRP